MTVNRNLTRTLLVPAIVLGALCGSSAALAATGRHAAPTAKRPAAKQRVLRRGMNVVGFNAAVAKAHGYKIVTYANGDQQSVPIDPKSRLPKSPILHHDYGLHPDGNSDYNKVVGNCGTSWIAVLQTGASQVQVASGFTVSSSPAIGYSWTVSLSDANGTSQQSESGELFSGRPGPTPGPALTSTSTPMITFRAAWRTSRTAPSASPAGRTSRLGDSPDPSGTHAAFRSLNPGARGYQAHRCHRLRTLGLGGLGDNPPCGSAWRGHMSSSP